MAGFWRLDTAAECRVFDNEADAKAEAIRLKPALSVVWFQEWEDE